MTYLPHAENIIKKTEIVIHYPHVSIPITEPFCPVRLSEYLRFGWQQCLTTAGDTIQLIHPSAPYRARA